MDGRTTQTFMIACKTITRDSGAPRMSGSYSAPREFQTGIRMGILLVFLASEMSKRKSSKVLAVNMIATTISSTYRVPSSASTPLDPSRTAFQNCGQNDASVLSPWDQSVEMVPLFGTRSHTVWSEKFAVLFDQLFVNRHLLFKVVRNPNSRK